MKKIAVLLLSLCIVVLAHAQLIKRVGQRVKETVEWKAQQKVNQKVDQGMDSLFALPGKKSPKQTKENKPAKNSSPENKTGTIKSTSTTSKGNDEPLTQQDGFVTLQLSTPVTTKGLSVIFSGESVVHEKFKQVKLTVTGPSDFDKTVNLNLDKEGKYKIEWNDLPNDGEYRVVVSSSDGKAEASEPLIVMDWEENKDENADLVEAAGKAFERLKDKADDVKSTISSKDKIKLDQTIAEAKERLDALYKLMNSLTKAKNEISKGIKSGKTLSPNFSGNYSRLTESITTKTAEIKKIGSANHEAADNTVCEYIVMLNEACAAFSTVSNFWTKSISGIVQNIILDKGVPKVVETVNSKTLNAPSPMDWGAKEYAKIFATAKVDAESLTTKMGKAGLAGDIIQFGTDVLLKIYCGTYKGMMKHDYTINFRNSNGQIWWKYSVQAEAAVSLRYPKNQTGGIIKMKGNIEGNATKFTFFADNSIEDEFRKGSAGKVEVMVLKNLVPPAIPSATSNIDALGFGAVARGVVTPAYFNIPIDAEFDTESDKINIFVNEAIIDFTPLVKNTQIFLLWAAGLPLIKKMDYPIHPARLTINASLRDKNSFDMEKDSKGNPFFTGKKNKHVGTSGDAHEADINTTLTLKKD
jgi:hypothetical protein